MLAVDGSCDRGNDAVAVKPGEGRDLALERRCRRRRRRRRQRRGGGNGRFRRRSGRRAVHGGRRLDRGGPALGVERRLVGRDRIGQLLDQRRQFLDLGGERLRCRQGAVDHGVDFALHRAKPAAEFGQLAGEIAGAARQIGELVARFQAIVLARGDGVIDRERGERAERHQRRFGAGKAEAQIDHNADRAGDEHHAGRNEDGADAHHAALLPIPPEAIRA